MNLSFNKRDYAVLLISECVLIVLAAPNLNARFVHDEPSFLRLATQIANTGVMEIVYHPPTYWYYLAGLIEVFGASELVIRGGTFVFVVLTVPIVYLLAKTLIAADNGSIRQSWRQRSWLFPGLVVGLYVTSPLVIQDGTLVDIDGSILTFATTVFLLWVIWATDVREIAGKHYYAGLGIGFFCVSWVKFGGLPPLFGAIVAYLVITGRVRRALGAALTMTAAAAAFVATWWVVAGVTGLSFIDPFVLNFGRWVVGGAERAISDPTQQVLTSVWVLIFEVLWISPFLIALALFGTLSRLANWRQLIRLRIPQSPSLLLVGFAGLTIVEYVVLAKIPGRFPKYMGPAMPAFAAAAGVTIGRFLPSPFEKSDVWFAGMIVAAAAATLVFVLPDPFLSPYNVPLLEVAWYILRVSGQYLLISSVVLGIVVYWFRSESPTFRLSLRSTLVIVLLILTVGTNVGLVGTQASADYRTQYFYGEEGREGALGAVQLTGASCENGTVVAPGDFSYYVNSPIESPQEYADAPEKLLKMKPEIVVLHQFDETNTPVLEPVLRENRSYRHMRFGSFSVYSRTNRDC